MVLAYTVLYSFVLVGMLAYTIRRSLTVPSKEYMLRLWAVFGFLSNFIILSAYYVTLPIEGVSFAAGFLLITAIISFLSCALGILYLPVGYVFWITRRSHRKQFALFVIAFVLAEVARPYLFTLLTWGGGSTFGAHGSTWSLGSVLASTPLVTLAYYGGVFTLGFVLVSMISVAVFPFQYKVKIGALLLILVAWGWVRYGVGIPERNSSLRFGIVQTSFPHVPGDQDIDEAYKQRVEESIHPLVMSFTKDAPQMIILPEDVRYLDLISRDARNQLLQAFPDTLIVDGATRITKSGRKNTSILYDTKTNTTYTRNKEFMFPFGEYIPYILKGPIAFVVGEKRLKEYERVREYTSGTAPHAQHTRFGAIGVLICSELTSHDAVMSLKASHPDVIIVQSSLTWTHNNPYYMMNHVLALKILAASVRKPVISVTNSGPSIMIDADGNVVSYEESAFATHIYNLQNGKILKVY